MDSMHELKHIVLLTIKCFLKLHQLSWYCCLWCLPWDNNHCEFLPEISNKLGDTWSGTWSFPSLKNISNFFRLLCMWLVLLLTRDWNGHWKAMILDMYVWAHHLLTTSINHEEGEDHQWSTIRYSLLPYLAKSQMLPRAVQDTSYEFGVSKPSSDI